MNPLLFCRIKFHKANGYSLKVLLLLSTFTICSPLSAQSQTSALWLDLSPTESAAVASHLLHESASYQRAISVKKATLESFVSGSTVSLELAPGSQRLFELTASSSYANGDTGWRGSASDTTEFTNLSLVYNANTLIASIRVGDRTFKVSAAANSDLTDEFQGYLYEPTPSASMSQIDEAPEVIRHQANLGQQRLPRALGGADISLEQIVDDYAYFVGEEVELTVKITNKTDKVVSDKQLRIRGVLTRTELIGIPENCVIDELDASSPTIRCELGDLAPGETVNIDYTLKITELSYPFVSMQALFGPNSGKDISAGNFFLVSKDTIKDADDDSYSDFNELILGTDPLSAESAPSPDYVAEIDVLFLYTPTLIDDVGEDMAVSKINQMVETTNAYFAESDARVSFNPVYYRLVDYNFDIDGSNAFGDMRAGNPPFEFLSDLRSQLGADIVAVIDGYKREGDFCGFGSFGGPNTNGELLHAAINPFELFSFQYVDGKAPGENRGCSDQVLAHEFGHNLGLDHSRRDPDIDSTFPWALGHGIDGEFHTIMAYSSRFPGSKALPLFSNPRISTCNGHPCGVSKDDTEQGADAAATINHTGIQLAGKRESRQLAVQSLAGETSLKMYGAATRPSDPDIRVSKFLNFERMDVNAALLIPEAHQGMQGLTHVVVAIPSTGLFYIDVDGNFQSWDGEFETLGARNESRPLEALEQLNAFESVTPKSVGIEEGQVTVYFAYAVPELDVFVYSKDGITFTVNK